MDTKKRIYGLIGYPIKHSLSPAMHNAAFAALKINAEYKLFEVKPDNLENFLENLGREVISGLDPSFKGIGWSILSGLNVTVPYKEKVLDFVTLDIESFYLRQVKAINTIVKEGNIWKGFNTDIPGFSKHLKENFNPEGKKVALLGAGGASRAVAYVLANSRAKEIAIFDVDKNKSGAVSKMIKSLFSDFPIYAVGAIEELKIKDKDLLINATPVGLKESDPCLVKEEMLHKNLFVYDLIYNPAQTKLLKLAKEKGCRCSNGLGMLLYQGMLSFEIWTGKLAPKEVMKQFLLEALKNR